VTTLALGFSSSLSEPEPEDSSSLDDSSEEDESPLKNLDIAVLSTRNAR
jgi:hypothetical protein